MPLINYLPLVTTISFVVSFIVIILSMKGKNIKYALLICFMLGTSLAIAIIEAIVIYHYHGLDNQIILDKMPVFIILLIVNSLFCLIKALFVKKEMTNDSPDYGKLILKISGVDPLCLGLLIVTIVIFKV